MGIRVEAISINIFLFIFLIIMYVTFRNNLRVKDKTNDNTVYTLSGVTLFTILIYVYLLDYLRYTDLWTLCMISLFMLAGFCIIMTVGYVQAKDDEKREEAEQYTNLSFGLGLGSLILMTAFIFIYGKNK